VRNADRHGDGIEGARHGTRLAAGAAITVVQSGKFLPALPFKRQQMKMTSGDAPPAAGAARGVDSREGNARPHDRLSRVFQADLSGVQCHLSHLAGNS